MKILVCLTHVPDTTSRIAFTDNNSKFDNTGVQFIIGPYDDYALARAVEIKEATGGTLTVLNVGEAESEPTIRKALAIGAEKAGERGDIDRREKYLDTLRSLQRVEALPYDARAVFDVTDFYDGRLSLEDSEALLDASQHDPHDEIQTRLMLSLSYTYQRADHDSATQHAARMLELSDQHQLAPQRAWSLFALGCVGPAPESEEAPGTELPRPLAPHRRH